MENCYAFYIANESVFPINEVERWCRKQALHEKYSGHAISRLRQTRKCNPSDSARKVLLNGIRGKLLFYLFYVPHRENLLVGKNVSIYWLPFLQLGEGFLCWWTDLKWFSLLVTKMQGWTQYNDSPSNRHFELAVGPCLKLLFAMNLFRIDRVSYCNSEEKNKRTKHYHYREFHSMLLQIFLLYLIN